MFNLIKINGARTNVPEPIILDIDGVKPYTAGNLYFIGDDTVSNLPFSAYDLKFIPLETIPANSGKKKICGYFVNENMIFETEIYGDFTSILVGNILAGHTDANEDICGAEGSLGEDIMLISKAEVKAKHKVLVALKW